MQLLLDELGTLILMMRLVKLQFPGLLDEALAPLERRLDKLPETKGLVAAAARFIRSVPMPGRPWPASFGDIGTAVLLRQRLSLTYIDIDTGKKTKHEVSPQHLLHYRDRLYLDAWCHKDKKLHTFEIHYIEDARMLDTLAIEIPAHELEAYFSPAYGIHPGPATAIAEIRFSRELARRIKGDILHPRQEVTEHETGEVTYKIPYNRDDELILDIMRYGPDAEVVGPPPLREKVAERLSRAAGMYRGETPATR